MESSSLLVGLLFGSIGIGYFIYGRRQANVVARYTGVALMFFPYFVDSLLAMFAVGVVLMLVPKFLRL